MCGSPTTLTPPGCRQQSRHMLSPSILLRDVILGGGNLQGSQEHLCVPTTRSQSCRAFGLHAMGLTISGLCICNPGVIKLIPGERAGTDAPSKQRYRPLHPHPHMQRSWLSPWQAANRQEPPSQRQGGIQPPLSSRLRVCWKPSPAAITVMQGNSLIECGFCMLKIESDRLPPRA